MRNIKDMLQICLINILDVSEKCMRYVQVMSKIWMKNVFGMWDYAIEDLSNSNIWYLRYDLRLITHLIKQRYTMHMPDICLSYVIDTSEICLIYIWDRRNICLRYVWDMSKIYQRYACEICLWYVVDLSRICLRYVLDIP